jgi:geranylgeranyl pyrophosphate synthase
MTDCVSGQRFTAPDQSVRSWLSETVKPAVDARIESVVADSAFPERLSYQPRTGGKRLRAGFTLLVSQIQGIEHDTALDIAAGVELLHHYSLVHDDLVDGDELRRGKAALWAEYDTADAVFVGTLLQTAALELFPQAMAEEAIATTRELTAGQQLDVDFESRRDLRLADYDRLARLKTGALFRLCFAGPVAVSEQQFPLALDALDQLWVAFQMHDDLADLREQNGTGTVGGDIREGKRTSVTIHADDDAVYSILDAPPASTTDEDIEFVLERYAYHGSVEAIRQRTTDNQQAAMAELRSLPDGPATSRLEQLCQFLTDRDPSSQNDPRHR